MSANVKSNGFFGEKSNASYKNVNNENEEKIESTVDEPQASQDEDDPCAKKTRSVEVEVVEKFRTTPGLDPRFQQQNQTMRCFVMYTDFYRCEKILGEGNEACTWFRDVFKSICPNAWISRWDEFRAEGRLPWSRRDQGDFPGDRYG